MRKIVSLFLVFLLIASASAACAEKREAPADKKVITTQDVNSYETSFRQYDSANFGLQAAHARSFSRTVTEK